MGNKLSGNILSNKTCEIGGNILHSIFQVLLHLLSVVYHFKSFVAEFKKGLDIKLADLLTH